MRTKVYVLLVLIFPLFLVPIVPRVRAESTSSREYQIKAAFVYNFMNFVDWPKDRIADANQPIIIGVIGCEDFVKALKPIEQKKIKGRKILIKYFPGHENLRKPESSDDSRWKRKIAALKVCHVLLLCTFDNASIESSAEIVKALRGSPILTVGETSGFLTSGGMINFLMKDEKIRFEINNTAAKRAGLKIRSKLLRLAERVIGQEASDGTED